MFNIVYISVTCHVPILITYTDRVRFPKEFQELQTKF